MSNICSCHVSLLVNGRSCCLTAVWSLFGIQLFGGCLVYSCLSNNGPAVDQTKLILYHVSVTTPRGSNVGAGGGNVANSIELHRAETSNHIQLLQGPKKLQVAKGANGPNHSIAATTDAKNKLPPMRGQTWGERASLVRARSIVISWISAPDSIHALVQGPPATASDATAGIASTKQHLN